MELDTLVWYYSETEDLKAEVDRRRTDFWAWKEALKGAASHTRPGSLKNSERKKRKAKEEAKANQQAEEKEKRKAEKEALWWASLSEREKKRILQIRRWKRVNALNLLLPMGLSFDPESPRDVEQVCRNFANRNTR